MSITRSEDQLFPDMMHILESMEQRFEWVQTAFSKLMKRGLTHQQAVQTILANTFAADRRADVREFYDRLGQQIDETFTTEELIDHRENQREQQLIQDSVWDTIPMETLVGHLDRQLRMRQAQGQPFEEAIAKIKNLYPGSRFRLALAHTMNLHPQS